MGREMSTDDLRQANATLEQLLRLVSDPVRRHALRYLAEAPGGGTPVEELERALLNTDALADQTRAELETGLYHVHLPALADRGPVDFDREQAVVHFEGDERVETLLERIETLE